MNGKVAVRCRTVAQLIAAVVPPVVEGSVGLIRQIEDWYGDRRGGGGAVAQFASRVLAARVELPVEFIQRVPAGSGGQRDVSKGQFRGFEGPGPASSRAETRGRIPAPDISLGVNCHSDVVGHGARERSDLHACREMNPYWSFA